MERTRRKWPTSDAGEWGGRLPLMLWAGLLSVLNTLGGIRLLGGSDRDRLVGVGEVAVGVGLAVLVVLLARRRARMWHALLATVVVAVEATAEPWLTSGHPSARLPIWEFVLLGWVLVDWWTYPRFRNRQEPAGPTAHGSGHADGLGRPEDAGCQIPPRPVSDN